MSWSISFIGKPEKVVEALNANSEKLSDNSKIEYDAALPHLVALVNENFGNDYPVKLAASGSGYSVNGEQKNRNLTVSLEVVYGLLV